MIKLFRVDDRLIHGQVAFAWTRATGTDHIIVVNDEAYSDNIKKMTLKLAKPAGTGLTIVPVSKFELAFDKYKNNNLMILVASTQDARAVAEKIPELDIICLGGLRPGEGKKTVASAINLSPDDFQNLNHISQSGIDIVIQETPTSKKLNYSEIKE